MIFIYGTPHLELDATLSSASYGAAQVRRAATRSGAPRDLAKTLVQTPRFWTGLTANRLRRL